MIQQILEGISKQIKTIYTTSKIYFNPIREVKGDSFIINLIRESRTGEPGNIDLRSYDFNVSYIPPVLQQIPYDGEKETRLFNASDVIDQLYELLHFITIKGFYQDKKQTVESFNRYSIFVGDIMYFFFSIELRTRSITDNITVNEAYLKLNEEEK